MAALHPKYAHSAGSTKLSYTRDGRYLFTAGANQLVRKFIVGSVDEPDTIDVHDAAIVGLKSFGSVIATCCDDGTARIINAADGSVTALFCRCSLAIRDLCFSPDGDWVAVCSDDATVKLVNLADPDQSIDLTSEHLGGVKHVSYDHTGSVLATTSLDGRLRFFSVSSHEPELLQALNFVVPTVNGGEDVAFTGVSFHPDGRHFAVPVSAGQVALYTRDQFLERSRFAYPWSEAGGAVTCLSWSPSGRFLAAGYDNGRLAVWDCKAMELVVEHSTGKNNEAVTDVAWHPSANSLSFTTNFGLLYTITAVLSSDVPLPYGTAISLFADHRPELQGTYDKDIDQDSDKGEDLVNDDNWIEDDDGSGYVEKKRPAPDGAQEPHKRLKPTASSFHAPFQTGQTPWKANRRYMCMNSVGYVWTVDQDIHNIVTVNFYDRDVHREFHFTDYDQYTMAALTAEACLLAKPEKALLRFHDGSNDNWEFASEPADPITAISLSDDLAVLGHESGVVRIFNRFGTLLRLYRQSALPLVTSASFQNFVLTVRSDSAGVLYYTVENVQTDEVLQRHDELPVPGHSTLRAVFFSEDGDPCIYDSSGHLLVLSNWRTMHQARWVPVFDSMAVRTSDRETHWPLAVTSDHKFNCIVLRTGPDSYPSIPHPLFSEFDLTIPLGKDTSEYEASYLTQRLLSDLSRQRLSDALDSLDSESRDKQQQDLATQEFEVDRNLLRMLQMACADGKSARALGIVRLISAETVLEAASKMALRFEMTRLAQQINEEREARMANN